MQRVVAGEPKTCAEFGGAAGRAFLLTVRLDAGAFCGVGSAKLLILLIFVVKRRNGS